jgi:hypothetical protein
VVDVEAWSASTGAGVSSGTGRSGWWTTALVDWARWERGGLEVGDDTLESLDVNMSVSMVVRGVAVVRGTGSSVGCRVLSRIKGIASVFALALSSSWEGGEPFIVDALMMFASSSSWHKEIEACTPCASDEVPKSTGPTTSRVHGFTIDISALFEERICSVSVTETSSFNNSSI